MRIVRPTLVTHVLMPVALAALLLGLYAPMLNRPFMQHDFDRVINHASLTDPQALAKSFYHPEPDLADAGVPQYRPVSDASFYLNAVVTGVNPLSFRLVNLALLTVAGYLVALWLGGYTHSSIAWAAAFVFVAHPIHLNTIGDLAGRANTLTLIGVLAFATAQHHAQIIGRWRWHTALIAFVAALVALGSSQTGLTLIPVAWAQFYLARRHGDHWSHNTRVEVTPKPLSTAMILALPVTAYLVGRTLAIGWAPEPGFDPGDLGINPMIGSTLAQKIPACLSIAFFHARQVFWPDPGANQTPATLPLWGDRSVWLGAVVLFVALILLVRLLVKSRWQAVAVVLAWAQYLIVCGLFLPVRDYASNHTVGPMVLAAVMVLAAWRAAHGNKTQSRNAAMALVPAAALVLILGLVTVKSQHRWRSSLTLAQADYERQPENPVAMYDYATAMASVGNYAGARAIYEALLVRRPYSTQVLRGLVAACWSLGRLDEADQYARRWEESAVRDPSVALREADLARREGRLDYARQMLVSLTKAHPDNEKARKALDELNLALPFHLE
ncbi:MAG: hypothetical protein GC164_01465 [Phycisphaera sp.]|nr:hypothetical protein [Phycisphaera sp.]